MRAPLIYVSGPLTTGPTIENVRRALDTGWELIRQGYAVIIPHEKALAMEMLHPMTYEGWLTYDFRCIDSCDGVYRMAGKSRGGDAEVEYAIERRIPVFFSFDTLASYQWPELGVGLARRAA